MYSYLKCIVYDNLLKPRQSFRINLYIYIYIYIYIYVCVCVLFIYSYYVVVDQLLMPPSLLQSRPNSS